MTVHPRERGESVISTHQGEGSPGPSPRARGIRPAPIRGRPGCGSIPASAGNPSPTTAPTPASGVHPRERGESAGGGVRVEIYDGPSPRARGILRGYRPRQTARGSIPASAGNPACDGIGWRIPKVHPRERGESGATPRNPAAALGPSPRARGIRAGRGGRGALPGSIPASAGNPTRPRSPPRRPTVHPRERGESAVGHRPAGRSRGPSPRARGIHPYGGAGKAEVGSIPASAGNPAAVSTSSVRTRVHPRERGESAARWAGGAVGAGPSPRARGIPGRLGPHVVEGRSIPASAGNPPDRSRRPDRGWVHPRERGESRRQQDVDGRRMGPSPRARGIHGGAGGRDPARGSIPASAGNPEGAVAGWPASRVHPRERGESRPGPRPTCTRPGPSPRARGIPGASGPRGIRAGSIPASAGNPGRRRRRLPASRVHPRGRGESGPFDAPPPPPRVRSIPASAGNPADSRTSTAAEWVHPRERGESGRMQPRVSAARGPSPRARGIPAGRWPRAAAAGSIPASAGNPAARPPTPPRGAVHPRERGESVNRRDRRAVARGPSPRARGIRASDGARVEGLGSIPASAGNPQPGRAGRPRRRVHPRERGESPRRRRVSGLPAGPSPRARGIRAVAVAASRDQGSIPASAGNPPAGRPGRKYSRVHPRERGESPSSGATWASSAGPSPRARGIRRPAGECRTRVRSIPASAGNPPGGRRTPWPPPVHPRERGESIAAITSVVSGLGPSPRARGILRRQEHADVRHGSIPASAGNPWSAPRTPPPSGVHPRERGESRAQVAPVELLQGPSPRARGIRRGR